MNTNSDFNMQTPNWTNENARFIAERFPNCVTETADGLQIDFDLLRQELSGDVIEGYKERYRLEWPGKREAIVTANLPTTNTLRPVREDSVNFDTTQNLYIEGDNLEVLKLLQESYLNKVKMIYIDPPYNTGNDFVYKDNFRQDSEAYKEESGLVDEYNQRLQVNPDTAGRYHSNWLSMMYPRLKLARNLLKEDGVIFISIDDNEVHNLRKVCDEIFGSDNFINEIVINMNSLSGVKMTHAIKGKRFPAQKEYLLLYKKGGKIPILDIPKKPKEKWDKEYNLIIPELLEKQFIEFDLLSDKEVNNLLSEMTLLSLSEYSKEKEIEITDEWKWQNSYRIFGTKSNTSLAKKVANKEFSHTIICYTNSEGNKRYFRSDFNKNVKDPRIELVQAYSNSTVFISDNWIDISNDGGVAQEGGIIFPNGKKPLALINRIIGTSNSFDGIILDFFSGSSTTAHATFEANYEDGGNRKFIMVQIPELTEIKSIHYKEGFYNICEIGKERIRRAGKKIVEEQKGKIADLQRKMEKVAEQLKELQKANLTIADDPKATALQEEKETLQQQIEALESRLQDLDIGFRVFRLDSSNMTDVFYRPQDYEQGMLGKLIGKVKEDRSDEDLLAQVLLDWGLPLSLPIEQAHIGGKRLFKVAGNSLYACFEKMEKNNTESGIDDDFVKEIAKDTPLRVVFGERSFKDDTAKNNAKQILLQLSPETEMKVI